MDFDKNVGIASDINRPFTVMELKIVSLPGEVQIIGRADKIFATVFGMEDQVQESLKKCTEVFKEEAAKITEKLGVVKSVKFYTNMKEKP